MNSQDVSVDQSARDLILSVIRGPVVVEDLFDVKAKEMLVYSNFAVDANIIGESHAISLMLPGLRLCEVFACVAPDIKKKRIVYGPLNQFSDESIKLQFGRVSYKFRVKILSWDKGEKDLKRLEKMIHRSKNVGNEIGLTYEFPKCASSVRTPKTLVLVEGAMNQIVVNTIHSYPNESNIVLTKSQITL